MEAYEEVFGAAKLKQAYIHNDFVAIKEDYNKVMDEGSFEDFCNTFDEMHEEFGDRAYEIGRVKKENC
jgi:hypothetical protein